MKIKTKISAPKLITLGVLLALSIVTMVFWGVFFGGDSIFNGSFVSDNVVFAAIVNNFSSLVAAAIIVIFAITVYEIFQLITNRAFKGNKRFLTIISLLNSLIRWAIVIATILLVLWAFKVDTNTILASAGIITLVVGLGAQSLIADILAGFFLVFENEYQVGDIISIDGWRGEVKEIGIRVTRLVDMGGNIKTINNSDVKNVVNQTNELSIAKVIMPIDYGESLERVEVILKNNFEKVKANIPDIIEGPFYKGVSELGESSVNLLFIAKCKEDNIYQVQRDLLREFYIIFNNNDITVPFNQVVLSNREEPAATVTKKQAKEAKAFLDAQKEAAKKSEESVTETAKEE